MAIECDRYEQRVVHPYDYFSFKKGNIKHGILSVSYILLDSDLCPDCVEDFKKFMKNDVYKIVDK